MKQPATTREKLLARTVALAEARQFIVRHAADPTRRDVCYILAIIDRALGRAPKNSADE